MQRQLKKEVKIGSIKIGGTNPIAVQTMLNVPVKDIAGNVAQAERVAKAGCQIVRVTVPTPADAAVVAAIKEKVDIPIVADIHFDYRAARAAREAAGRLACLLAARADCVVQMFCGLPTILKGELLKC